MRQPCCLAFIKGEYAGCRIVLALRGLTHHESLRKLYAHILQRHACRLDTAYLYYYIKGYLTLYIFKG